MLEYVIPLCNFCLLSLIDDYIDDQVIKHILVFVSQGLFSRTSNITTQTLTLIHVLIFFTGQGEFRPEHPESEPSSGTPGG